MKLTNAKDGTSAPTFHFLSELLEDVKLDSDALSKIGSCGESQEEVVRILANRGSPTDIYLFDRLESACYANIDCVDQSEKRVVINVMHLCSLYFEALGHSNRALNIALQNLGYARALGDKDTIRRAHSLVGENHTNRCEFNLALEQMHLAYQISLERNDNVGQFMALANVVAIFESMGLLKEAQRLSLRLATSFDNGTEKLDSLHVSNASNGLRISHLLKDMNAANLLYEIALRSSKTKSRYFTDINRAHFDAARIVHLALTGNEKSAEQIAHAALEVARRTRNVQVIALLTCAQADCYMATNDVLSLIETKNELESLLPQVEGLAQPYEELAFRLIRIDAHLGKKQKAANRQKLHKYLTPLKIHSLKVKHRSFFLSLIEQAKEEELSGILSEGLFYTIPEWISDIYPTIDPKVGDAVCSAGNVPSNKLIPYDINEIARQYVGYKVDTKFRIIESWAIGIECILGSDGYNGARVGHIALEIAKEIGYPIEMGVRLERACRLYDIGKLVFLFVPAEHLTDRALGKFSLFSKHTLAGARLLVKFDDATLQLASSIALGHHEWWNGCGYPLGLKAHEIPIESRICCLADFLVSLARPVIGKKPWPIISVARQIRAMSGVQFDPEMCLAAEKILLRQSEDNLSSALLSTTMQ